MGRNTTRRTSPLTTTPVVIFPSSSHRAAIFVPAHATEIIWADFGRDPGVSDGIPILPVSSGGANGVWFNKADYGEWITQDFRARSATNAVTGAFYDIQEF